MNYLVDKVNNLNDKKVKDILIDGIDLLLPESERYFNKGSKIAQYSYQKLIMIPYVETQIREGSLKATFPLKSFYFLYTYGILL